MSAAVNEASINFTTSIFPAGPGSRKSYCLPLGFIFSPLKDVSSIQRVDQKEMNICQTCGAYRNIYCPSDEYGAWICCICEEQNTDCTMISSSSAAFESHVIEYRQRAAGMFHAESTDYYGDANSVSSEMNVIVLDSNLPPEEVQAILTHLSSLKLERVGLVIFSNLIHVYQLSLKGIASADVYSPLLHPLDSGIDIGDRLYFGDWDQLQYCAEVYFGTSASSSFKTRQPISRREMLKMKKNERLESQKGDRLRQFDGFDPKQGAALLQKTRNTKIHNTANRKLLRCTGDAVLLATHMITASGGSKTGRVYVFTNGCCNFGQLLLGKENIQAASVSGDIGDTVPQEEVADNLYTLGKEAFMNGIGIDVFCIGSDVLNVQTLLALVKYSGGYVLSYSSYEGVEFQHDFAYVCSKTRMSRAVCDVHDSDNMISAMSDPNKWNTLNGVVVDIRMSRCCVPILCHGQVAVFDECQCPLPNEKGLLSPSKVHSANIINSIATQMQLGRVDPNVSLSIVLRNQIDIPENSSVYFQFTSRFLDGIDLVTRVFTHRMETSTDPNTYLQALNSDVISVLIAKEAAYRAMTTTDDEGFRFNMALGQNEVEKKIHSTKNDLDFTVHKITETHGSYNGQRIVKEARLSPELYQVLMNLYHFRRGCILGEGSHSLDDRALNREIFLRKPLSDCMLMMTPLLYRCDHQINGGIEFVPIPAGTLALWDASVLAVDTFDSLYVWSGCATNKEVHNVKRTASMLFLKEKSRTRIPTPRIYELMEGESMCRKMTSRLAPSHGDPPNTQLSHFPDLSSLDDVQLTTLRSKFVMYNSQCDPSFIDWFLRVMKLPPKGKLLFE